MVIELGNEHNLQPWKSQEAVYLETSSNLSDWDREYFLAGTTVSVPLNPAIPIRYIRFPGTPERILEINALKNGIPLDCNDWRASHLFSSYQRCRAEKAWNYSVVLDEIPPGAYLAICLEGQHGAEGAYAAARIDGVPVGAPDRSPSYPENPWEYPVAYARSHNTYYIPLTADMENKPIDVFVLGLKSGLSEFDPVVWLTAYPVPYLINKLTLYR